MIFEELSKLKSQQMPGDGETLEVLGFVRESL